MRGPTGTELLCLVLYFACRCEVSQQLKCRWTGRRHFSLLSQAFQCSSLTETASEKNKTHSSPSALITSLNINTCTTGPVIPLPLILLCPSPVSAYSLLLLSISFQQKHPIPPPILLQLLKNKPTTKSTVKYLILMLAGVICNVKLASEEPIRESTSTAQDIHGSREIVLQLQEIHIHFPIGSFQIKLFSEAATGHISCSAFTYLCPTLIHRQPLNCFIVFSLSSCTALVQPEQQLFLQQETLHS